MNVASVDGFAGLDALFARLGKGSPEPYEIFAKRGRTRRFELGPEGESFVQSAEAGWAVRAGDGARSRFAAGSGEPPAETVLPPPTSHPLRLPSPSPPRAGWRPPSGVELPLATEAEGWALLAGIARELARELAGARLVSARLDDGASASRLRSSTGIAAGSRARAATLRLEAEQGGRRVAAEWIARAASELKPLAVARRVADRLQALAPERPHAGELRLLLAPPVAARLVEALATRLVGEGAHAAVDELVAAGRVASPLVTLIDDGGRPDGLLSAAADGEGVPTGEARLIEEGRFVAPLIPRRAGSAGVSAPGCMRRVGWREPPRPGASELWLLADPAVAVGDLLAGGEAAAYLIATEGGVRWLDGGRELALPVSGFALEGGRAAGGLGPCRLRGRLASWLHGIHGRARDLSFVPGDGLFGAPTLLVEGLALEAID
jgi:TldD protein